MARSKTVAIIQARMGSTRLPGKVLLDLGGWSMLARVVRRTARAMLVDEVVVATTSEPADDPIVEECGRLAVGCFRGSAEDVLDRYHQAATACRADVVVRITADCPLIDPGETDRVVHAFSQYRPDYASNILRRTYPRGLDTEVMTVQSLARARLEADRPYERIHVTPYIHQNPDKFQLLSVTNTEDHSDSRWTVDSPEDLAFVRELYRLLDNDDTPGWRGVRRVLEANPAMASMNRHVRQKELVEG